MCRYVPDSDRRATYLLLTLPFTIQRGSSEVEGKGIASRRDTIAHFVTLLADDEELTRLLSQRKRDITELLLRKLNSPTDEDRTRAAINAVSSLKPFIVGWSNNLASLKNYSIIIPTGDGGYLRHNYFDSPLSEVVVEYFRVVYGFYLNYPSPTRHVWTFVERQLIDLFPSTEAFYSGYLSAVALILPSCLEIDRDTACATPNPELSVDPCNLVDTPSKLEEVHTPSNLVGEVPSPSSVQAFNPEKVEGFTQGTKRSLFTHDSDKSLYSPSSSGSDTDPGSESVRPRRRSRVSEVKSIGPWKGRGKKPRT